jgi:hypothetical protein
MLHKPEFEDHSTRLSETGEKCRGYTPAGWRVQLGASGVLCYRSTDRSRLGGGTCSFFNRAAVCGVSRVVCTMVVSCTR